MIWSVKKLLNMHFNTLTRQSVVPSKCKTQPQHMHHKAISLHRVAVIICDT